MRISGKTYSIILPIIISAVFASTLGFMHKPILSEVLAASTILSALYFIFTFICLFFNIGTRKSSTIQFSDVPGLTKKDGWFGRVASIDMSGAIDFTSGADHPIALIVGFLLSILVSILLPIIIAILVFLVSGGIEFIVFVGAVISYFSFYQILRYQLTKRKDVKFKFGSSFSYSLMFTLSTIGLVPIGLLIFMGIVGKH